MFKDFKKKEKISKIAKNEMDKSFNEVWGKNLARYAKFFEPKYA